MTGFRARGFINRFTGSLIPRIWNGASQGPKNHHWSWNGRDEVKTNPSQRAVHADVAAKIKTDLVEEPESILGHGRVSNYAGVIRSGTKVPHERGKNVLTPEEMALYVRRTHERVCPKEIEKELGKPLCLKNAPFFSVYRSECKNNPDHADLIRHLYANSRGEIDRLKITFVSENWWEIIPQKLIAFRRGEIFCSSEPIGGKLIATRDPEIEPDQQGNKGRGLFPKKITLPCVPHECPIYQESRCRFSGVLHFLILGVPGTDLWRLPTQSWYSLRGMIEKIRMFKAVLARTGQSMIGIPFDLFKAEAEISRWDNEKAEFASSNGSSESTVRSFPWQICWFRASSPRFGRPR